MRLLSPIWGFSLGGHFFSFSRLILAFFHLFFFRFCYCSNAILFWARLLIVKSNEGSEYSYKGLGVLFIFFRSLFTLNLDFSRFEF